MEKKAKSLNILINYNELILHAIAHHNCSPEDIAEIFKTYLKEDAISEAAIRSRLKYLEGKNFVSYQRCSIASKSKFKRRYYSLTSTGQAKLEDYELLKDNLIDLTLLENSNTSTID